MRGVSLDEICAATRISTRFLEALESENWEVLPGGVFNRGFVRAVSRFLGLDEEGMVAEYAMAMSEHTPAPAWSRPPVPAPQQDNRRWIAWVLATVVLVLAGASWFGWHLIARRRAQRAGARAATATVAATPLTSVPPPSPVTDGNPGSSEVTAPSGSATSAPAPAPAPGQTIDGSLELKIDANKATMVAVEADGLPLFNGNIDTGQSRTFYAQTDFQISARDAGALSLTLNGQPISPIGPAGQPGKVMLTRRDLNAAAGGPH